MRSLRTMSTRRLFAVIAGTVALIAGGTAIALAAGSNGPVPPPKPLAQAIHDAASAPAVDGITARIKFTNHLIDSSSLQGSDPILSGATGRLWIGAGHRLRLELQADNGDAQIVSDGKTVTVYDATMNTVYRADLPQDKTASTGQADTPPTLASIQAELAKLAEHWNVSGAQPTSQAGQPAYRVEISPKHDGGLLGAAQLVADANTGVPLRAAVYAAGTSSPVLELEVTDISYGKVDSSVFDVRPPANAKVTDFTPKQASSGAGGAEAKPVTGAAAVAKAVPFTLAAPDKLVGLPRHEVRLVHAGDHPAALVTYGAGLGGIAVLQQPADANGAQGAPAKPREGESGLSLPTVSINGATGQELDTALGTMVRFTRGGVTYTVIGSVPPAAAEAAARGL